MFLFYILTIRKLSKLEGDLLFLSNAKEFQLPKYIGNSCDPYFLVLLHFWSFIFIIVYFHVPRKRLDSMAS